MNMTIRYHVDILEDGVSSIAPDGFLVLAMDSHILGSGTVDNGSGEIEGMMGIASMMGEENQLPPLPPNVERVTFSWIADTQVRLL